MPNLKCHEFACKFNNCSHCLVNTLSISKSAHCNDFERRKGNDEINYEFAFEKAMEISRDIHRILCSDLICVYNTGGECSASYIRVDCQKDKAYCCQARERYL